MVFDPLPFPWVGCCKCAFEKRTPPQFSHTLLLSAIYLCLLIRIIRFRDSSSFQGIGTLSVEYMSELLTTSVAGGVMLARAHVDLSSRPFI